MQFTRGPHTLCVDCGGSKLKAVVVDADGSPTSDRVRVATPYPCPPEVFLAALADLVADLPRHDRVSVGIPGLVRDGRVLATPHYVTEAGPFTPRRPDLVEAWSGFEARAALEERFGRPTRVVNDAELVALSVGSGVGYEVVITLGTGMGFAVLHGGRLLPKIELSQAPFRGGRTYDEALGDRARRKAGDEKWTMRVRSAVDALRPVLWWDALFVGGGNVKHLTAALGEDVTVVPNIAGLLGGIRLWDA